MKNLTSKNMGTGIALGVAFGAALGVALNNIATGVAFGAAFGVAFGTVLNKKDEISCLSPAVTRRLLFILLALGIFAGLGIIGYLLVK